MVFDGKEHPVEAPCVIVIPAGMDHDMLTGDDHSIEYVYVNDFIEK